MPTAIVPQLERIARFLRTRNWTETTGIVRGEMLYTSPKPKDEWQVQLTADGYWALCRFTDADRPVFGHDGAELLMAVGRFESIAEGDTLEELEETMVSEGIIEWACPYCGEEGGQPATHYSREYYGADYDGNRGEWREYEELCCTKCIGGLR